MTGEPTAALDRENVFLLYCTFAGDVVRTSAASGVPAAAILKMSSEEGWADKLAPILALKKSTRPGDLERGISRALCYVQAHQMRLIVQRAIQRITGMSAEEFDSYLLTETPGRGEAPTRKLTTRAIADLSAAMEKCHSMCYAALGDGQAERVKRKEQGEDVDISAGNLHAQIAAGLAAVRASATPRAMLFDAQIVQAQALVKESTKPANPLDNDDH